MSGLETYRSDRNRYFTGKLMTARDFELEQGYMNDRRRMNNRILHGTGIALGLRVLRLDGQTFTLEAGMALDALGREIVVEEPCVKRLSTVEGFEACRDSAWLCLRYAETLREETFSAATAAVGNLEREHNCVHEGYELYLTPDAPKSVGLGHLWWQELLLCDEDGLRLRLLLPRYARLGEMVRGIVRFEKCGHPAPAHYRLTLTGDLFSVEELCFDETEAGFDGENEQEILLRCTASGETSATLRAKQIFVACGALEITPQDRELELEVTCRSAAEAVAEAYFDREFTTGEDAEICLARLRLVSDASTCFIERVECDPLRQHLAGTALLQLLQSLPGERKEPTEQDDGARKQTVDMAVPSLGDSQLQVATGVETISLGFHPKPGKDYYSDEMVHGLGYGRVAVVTALENRPAPISGEEELLFFGEPGIFRGEEFRHTLPRVRLGAMVSPGRGSLRLGIHLLERTDCQTLAVRWWAFRKEEEVQPREETHLAVRITPNTASVKPLEQVRFSAMVLGDADQEVCWSVTDPAGGDVDANGLYLAPTCEGVFEIVAHSVKHGAVCGCAYVVVHEAEDEGLS